jgi:hypothetical protein
MDRLAARHADGWNAAWPNRAQVLAPRIAAIDAACRKVGRDPASLERSVGVMVDLPARGPSGIDRASDQPLAGSAPGHFFTGRVQPSPQDLGWRMLDLLAVRWVVVPPTARWGP